MIDRADNIIDLNAILHPGSVYDHPRDVVQDPTLSIREKRAVLASWASDAASVASNPVLRELPGSGRTVTIDEILEALATLQPSEGTSGWQAGSYEVHRANRPRSLGSRPDNGMTTMIDDELAQLRAHRNNISRYHRLLKTKLTEFERRFIERRLSEERSAIERLAASTFPLTFQAPIGGTERATTIETASG